MATSLSLSFYSHKVFMARQQLGKSCVEGRKSDRVIDILSDRNTWLLVDSVLIRKMADGCTKKSLCFVHLINHAGYFEFVGTSPN